MLFVNPNLIRAALSLWWFDCSARALLEEYRGQTKRLLAAENVRQLDPSKLQPGDFAVTADGVHVLAYLGEGIWIEADPGLQRVVRLNAMEENHWLKVPIVVMRWRYFE